MYVEDTTLYASPTSFPDQYDDDLSPTEASILKNYYEDSMFVLDAQTTVSPNESNDEKVIYINDNF